jgi:hypothetical protein
MKRQNTKRFSYNYSSTSELRRAWDRFGKLRKERAAKRSARNKDCSIDNA